MKKLFNYLSIIMCLVVFTACNDDDDYAAGPESSGPYFPSSLPSTVKLTKGDSSYTLLVYREGESEAATYNVSSVDESGKFNIPTTVNFAAGEKSAPLVITFDPEEIGYGMYSLSFAVDEKFDYGLSTYNLSIGVPEPYISLGRGTYSDSFLDATASYKVEILYNQEDPTRFRIMAPYSELLIKAEFESSLDGDEPEYVDLRVVPAGGTIADVASTTVDGLVVYNDIPTGWINPNYGEMVYLLHPARMTKYSADEASLTHNIVKQWQDNGMPAVIQLAPYYYMFGVGGWDNTQADGMVTIVFPGCSVLDMAAEVTYLGRFTDSEESDYAVATVTLGADVASAKAAIMETSNSDDVVNAIKNAEVETIDVKSGDKFNFAIDHSGKYVIGVVTYDEEGTPKESATTSFRFTSSKDGAETWNTLGLAQYTDDIIAPLYSADCISYEIEIQESASRPGVYRLVNPYGENYPYNEPGDWDASKNYYLEINAQDPEGVYIELQDLGIDWGDGMFSAYSLAGMYLDNGESLEDVKAAGLCGTLVDGIITFPEKSLIAVLGGDMYYANNNSSFKVVFPEGAKSLPKKLSAISGHRASFQPLKYEIVSKRMSLGNFHKGESLVD